MAKKKAAADDQRVIPIIAQTVFRGVTKGYQAAMRAVADAQDGVKDIIAKAVAKKHLHKGAFNLWYKLDKMDSNKRSELLHHFDHYRDCSDWDDQLDLYRKKAAEAPTAEEDESDMRGNGADEEEYATAH